MSTISVNAEQQLGALQADLAAVAKQRDALKRLVDEADELRNRQLSTIDSIKHGGLRILLALAHDVGDLERLLDAGDRDTEAKDAAESILGTSDPYEACRRLRTYQGE